MYRRRESAREGRAKANSPDGNRIGSHLGSSLWDKDLRLCSALAVRAGSVRLSVHSEELL